MSQWPFFCTPLMDMGLLSFWMHCDAPPNASPAHCAFAYCLFLLDVLPQSPTNSTICELSFCIAPPGRWHALLQLKERPPLNCPDKERGVVVTFGLSVSASITSMHACSFGSTPPTWPTRESSKWFPILFGLRQLRAALWSTFEGP